MSASSNREVIRLFSELVDLTKLDEGSAQSFRVRAYEKAASALGELDRDVADMTAADLAKLPGIGASSAKKIREVVDTGTMEKVEKLRTAYPPALLELTRIPGLGPKTVLLLRDRLGVEDVDGLKEAIAGERIRELPGMGAKSEEKLAHAIERLGMHGKDRRTPIAEALPIAEEIVAALSGVAGVKSVQYCGSLRRFRETIGDIDILVASTQPEIASEAFVELPIATEVVAKGETKSVILVSGGLQVDLRVVPPSSFGAAVMYFTGSKQHNIELRQRAIDRGWTLNEYGLSDVETDEVIASKTEKAIYAALDLPYVAAELREGIGEIASASTGELPKLVEERHIKGDLHVHSDWSGDGRAPLEAMLDGAAARGLAYVAITDHAEGLAINGLSRDRMLEQREVLAAMRAKHDDMEILHGAELNIAPDGSVDWDDDFLEGFDWGVASVHSHFDLDAETQTQRLITAMETPGVNAIGHLSGRMIGRRPGIEFDVDAVLDAAERTRCAIEINGHLDRLDATAEVLRRARGRDITFVLDTDAHAVSEYRNVTWAVHQSRRGWVDKSAVANTWPVKKFLNWADGKRRR
ncbi:MAG: DNA polymerase/3'-5' exonuclease PolX [Acidimicrobiia bacterium]|nr:DNA polymerase/3'-5' exonuclease PolX [Acidimicrobiia bacterium]